MGMLLAQIGELGGQPWMGAIIACSPNLAQTKGTAEGAFTMRSQQRHFHTVRARPFYREILDFSVGPRIAASPNAWYTASIPSNIQLGDLI